MKLGVAGVAMLITSAGCSPANVRYAKDLQTCIRDARDAGDSGAERLAAYTKCADALDKERGK